MHIEKMHYGLNGKWKIRLRSAWLDVGLYDIYTVSHVLQTGEPGFSYTYQWQNLLTMKNILTQRQYLIITPFKEVAGVNKPQKFVVLIKQLTFSEITLAGWMASFKILLYRWLVSRVYYFNSLITLLCS